MVRAGKIQPPHPTPALPLPVSYPRDATRNPSSVGAPAPIEDLDADRTSRSTRGPGSSGRGSERPRGRAGQEAGRRCGRSTLRMYRIRDEQQIATLNTIVCCRSRHMHMYAAGDVESTKSTRHRKATIQTTCLFYFQKTSLQVSKKTCARMRLLKNDNEKK